MDKLTETNIYLARTFSYSCRHIDDLLTFCNRNRINEHIHRIYPEEIKLNSE